MAGPRPGGRPEHGPVAPGRRAGVLTLWVALVAGAVAAQDASQMGGDPSRNMASPETGLVTSFDPSTGTNVLWSAALGSESYGGPTVAGGMVFVGTNNARPRDEAVTGDRGVLMAFRASDGTFLWQAIHDKLPTGRANDWPLQGVCSAPAVVGDRVYYVSNRAELVALDAEGFADGENDGPRTDEIRTGPRDADVVWTLDLIGELEVWPRFMSASSPLVVGDRIFLMTGNGPGEGREIPRPDAPSFLAVDRHTGKILWSDASPGGGLHDGQWSSPAHGSPGGRPQVAFAGGDGWIYSFAPETGRLLWKFDANRPLPVPTGAPEEASAEEPGTSREAFVGSPVFVGDRLIVGVGRDPEAGAAPGRLWALDATGSGDVTESAVAWVRHGADFGRTLSTVAVAGGLVFAADLSGFLHAFDAETGASRGSYDTFAAVWGSPLVADGKVFLGDEDGDLAVLSASPDLELLDEPNVGDAIYTTPVARDGVLYVVSRSRLFAVGRPRPTEEEGKKDAGPEEEKKERTGPAP